MLGIKFDSDSLTSDQTQCMRREGLATASRLLARLVQLVGGEVTVVVSCAGGH